MVAARKDFDTAVVRFGLSPTRCWMVGLGTADLMVLLSPSAWPKQACKHDPNDRLAVRQLTAHELIHAYHGQHNPTRDFSGIDGLDWFIEGLAVFGSGQLTKDRLDRMQSDLSTAKLPTALANVWTGLNRYAFAGSLRRPDMGTFDNCELKVHSSTEALVLLKTDEGSLLAGWKSSLLH